MKLHSNSSSVSNDLVACFAQEFLHLTGMDASMFLISVGVNPVMVRLCLLLIRPGESAADIILILLSSLDTIDISLPPAQCYYSTEGQEKKTERKRQKNKRADVQKKEGKTPILSLLGQ